MFRDRLGGRVIIIGAGLCGVYLARHLRLASPSTEVHVVELADGPGGRMQSHVMDGFPGVIELGAGRFNPTAHPRIAALVRELDLPIAPFTVRPAKRSGPIDARDLLAKVLVGTQSETWHEVGFLDLCRARLTADELYAFLSAQGYDILFEPTLPTSEAVRIIDDHPETTLEGNPWLQLRTGFQELTRRLHQEGARAGATFAFRTRVRRIERKGGGVTVYMDDGSELHADRVIATVPPRALANIELPLSDDRRRALGSVRDVPMMKGAFGFAESWWRAHGLAENDFVRVTNPLRKIYLRARQILVYADSAAAEYWRPLCDRAAVDSGLLWRGVVQTLREGLGLPSTTVIPEPVQQVACYWPAGVHAWKLGAVPTHVQRLLLGKDDRVHVCSEAFSPSSGWGEAALEMADLLVQSFEQPVASPAPQT